MAGISITGWFGHSSSTLIWLSVSTCWRASWKNTAGFLLHKLLAETPPLLGSVCNRNHVTAAWLLPVWLRSSSLLPPLLWPVVRKKETRWVSGFFMLSIKFLCCHFQVQLVRRHTVTLICERLKNSSVPQVLRDRWRHLYFIVIIQKEKADLYLQLNKMLFVVCSSSLSSLHSSQPVEEDGCPSSAGGFWLRGPNLCASSELTTRNKTGN